MQQPPSGYTQYPQQQQPYYQQPPQKPPKRKLSRRTWLIIIGVIVALIVLSGISNALQGKSGATTDSATATPTQTQSQPTVAPTTKPTQAKAPVHVAIVPTHGSPHLGGNISDFYGKFGKPNNTPGTGNAPSGQASMNVSWSTNDGNILGIQFYTSSHIVYYISYVGPSSWTKKQYQDYFIANFAPPGATINTQANQYWQQQGGDPYNPIAYDSAIGKFFLHISDGSGYMNTL